MQRRLLRLSLLPLSRILLLLVYIWWLSLFNDLLRGLLLSGQQLCLSINSRSRINHALLLLLHLLLLWWYQRLHVFVLIFLLRLFYPAASNHGLRSRLVGESDWLRLLIPLI